MMSKEQLQDLGLLALVLAAAGGLGSKFAVVGPILSPFAAWLVMAAFILVVIALFKR